MEDDFDIRTLPANFVSVSRPSKIIEKLIEKRKHAHNEVVEEMEFKKNEVNIEIESEIQNRSRILKDTIGKIKSDVEDSLFILRHTEENDIKLEENPLEAANKEIALANDTRRKAVDEFYGQLASIEKQRTKQFKLILNETYSKLSNISYKLPFELEEYFNHEILNINQLTVNNFQSYAELQSELQLQIENDTRMWIQMLSDLKEKVKKYHEALAREMMSKSRNSLNQSLTELLKENQLAKEIQNFDMLQSELESSLDQMMSIPVVLADVERLLDKTRTALAGLDSTTPKLLRVLIFVESIVGHQRFQFHPGPKSLRLQDQGFHEGLQKFFEELNSIKQFLDQSGIVDGRDIEDFQKEFYAPGVEELNLKHQADFVHLKTVWDEAINSMRNSVEETSSFLRDSAFLFDLHFQRVEDARQLVKRDLKNLVRKNSIAAEISEGKLNILIDKLRQGPTERRLEKCLMDVRKALDNIQKLYISQDAAEMKAVQKFRSMVNAEVDVLMSELHRFLTINPADEAHDPKIQRKRASQTSEIEIDPEEALIPVQMLFCKFQVEAVKNWQFGLWEAIHNYTQVGRAEILQTAEEWIKDQYTKINDRMTVKLAFHKPRYQRIICSVYEKRLYELEKHAKRFASHKTAVDMEIRKLKELQKLNEEKYDEICNNFGDKAEEIRDKILHTGSSGQVHRYNMLYKKCIQNAVNSVENVLCENTNLSKKLMEDLTFANMKFTKAMKFFSEGGNYTIEEVKNLMKNLNKLEKNTAKNLAVISKENSRIHMKFKANLDAGNAELSSSIRGLIQEHEHNENSVERIRRLQADIRTEVVNLKRGTKNLEAPFKDLVEISDKKLGQYDYVETFFFNFKQNENQIMGQAYFLLHPEPVVMYSSVSSAGPLSSTVDTRRVSKDYTSLLGVKPEADDCFVSKLINRLYNSLLYIQQKAQDFYSRHEDPMLDPSKIQPTYDAFMEEVLEKYKKYLVQCEVSWVENVYEFLVFLNKFLQFKEEYITAFESKFYNLSHKYCDTVMENIKKQLREEKEEIKNQLHGVHGKLKALHGHPNNRHLLEEIDREFKELANEIEQKLKHIATPNKEMLIEEYDTVKDISGKTNDVLKLLYKDDALARLRFKLNEQLTIKLDFVKTMMECEAGSEASSRQNELIRTISKQVLDYMNNALPPRSKSDDALVFSIEESYEESTSDDFLNELEEDLEGHSQSITDFVEVELVQYLKDFQETWPNEIKTIVGLFEVKYDRAKAVQD